MKDSIINYEIAFANFTQKIKKMTVGNIKKTGIKKIAKPVLLLAIIKGIENGTFKQNCFEYEQLDMIYEDIFKNMQTWQNRQNTHLLIILSIIYNQATSGNLVYSHLILKERHRHLLPTGFAEILNMHI